ncbi:aldolase [Meira miltonrushii]|uniref:Aldolase n=1 Tax=Meira miltonrushii TaxID=1280837 RepID=A0A316VH08_9BASI|nr:aldolase [Meira miltonrushii]PWN36929.1 aldolase [Meira miltonrushii]
MASTIDELRKDAPSLFLMGMRGAGKTTLGRLAAEHLNARFIDADDLFIERYGNTPKDFVAQNGWPAFRASETIILKELLQHAERKKEPVVVSLGGGVVEEECNRTLLKAAWGSEDGVLRPEKRVAVIHIFRELDKVLLDSRGLPKWTGLVAGGQEVWQRRRPWFRESSSHEFVNFTDREVLRHASNRDTKDQAESSRAERLRFEAVERDFVRFLVQLLASFQSQTLPWKPEPKGRSYLVTLPFADLHPHVDKLPLITLGADAIELRADLLNDPGASNGQADIIEAYENPSLSYLSEQVALIRRHLPDYPLVFTLRTPAQGGRYPYPADAPAKALFTSLRHALKLGCNVIDIEMGLDPAQTQLLIEEAKLRKITVLISWRDQKPSTSGGFDWDVNRATDLYNKAGELGADIVKIVGTAGKLSDNFALQLFCSGLESKDRLPLSAYNMSYLGRMSRFLNPVLASVTHPIAKELSKEGVVGNPSMTFEEIQRALHLSGLVQQAHFLSIMNSESNCQRFVDWFNMMGLPYTMLHSSTDGDSLKQSIHHADKRLGNLGGIYFPEGLAWDARDRLSLPNMRCDANVRDTGTFDCITSTLSLESRLINTAPQSIEWLASNKLVEALVDTITASISPSVHLTKRSRMVVLSAHNDSHDKVDWYVESARQIAKHFALLCTTHDSKNKQWKAGKMPNVDNEELSSDPTVIINCQKSSASFDPTLFENPLGGLYVDTVEDRETLQILQQDKFKNMGWRCITAAELWRQVDALRFRAFTGRRAPSTLSDSS